MLSESNTEPLVIGSRLGHFELVSVLGSGGMGVVYEARDLRLDRRVALKVLRPELFESAEARERMLREAKLSASLTHKNIAVVHEVDEDKGIPFIAMELLEGQSLKERMETSPLPVEEMLLVASQVCDALDAAHRRGIVHRDVKSSNILLTPDGEAKVVDFGLAKSVAPSSFSDEDVTRVREVDVSPTEGKRDEITSRGVVLGTPSYVSPEQAAGRTLDARSDLFSLGVVLYEGVTGELPFKGVTDHAILSAIRHDDPTPVPNRSGIPRDYSKVVERCLRKNPKERYQSASELKQDLTRLREGGRVSRRASRAQVLSAAGVVLAVLALAVGAARYFRAPAAADPPRIERIAVLPFEELSSSPDDLRLGDAVTWELNARLGQLGALKVAPWSIMRKFRDEPVPLEDLVEATGAQAVVEGSVQRIQKDGGEESVRVNARMVDTRSGLQIWSQTQEQSMGDFLSLQASLAQQIAASIHLKLERREEMQISRSRSVPPEAMELYLRGVEAMEDRSRPSLREAVAHFGGALNLAPRFPEALVGLANARLLLTVFWLELPAAEAYAQVMQSTERAREIDPYLAEAWATQAFAKQMLAWDWSGADADYRKALELSPSSAQSHFWYADYLSVVGRYDEAIAHGRIAEDRSPLSPTYSRGVGWCLFFARRYEEAAAQLDKTLRLDPAFVPAKTLLGRVYVMTRDYDRAVAALDAAGEGWLGMRAQAYAAAGRREEAERLLTELLSGSSEVRVSPFDLALIRAALGELDVAFELLEEGFEKRDPTMVNLKSNPLLDPLRSDPRYQSLLRRMGFPS